MPGCGMHSRPKLAEKASYNSLLKIKVNNNKVIPYNKIIYSNLICSKKSVVPLGILAPLVVAIILMHSKPKFIKSLITVLQIILLPEYHNFCSKQPALLAPSLNKHLLKSR